MSAPGPIVSLRGLAVGLKVSFRFFIFQKRGNFTIVDFYFQVFLHTNDKDVYSGFFGRYLFFHEKSVFGDGN